MSSSKRIYRAKHPEFKKVPQKVKPNYWRTAWNQSMVCGIIVLGVLVMQRLPGAPGVGAARRVIQSDMAFSQYNDWYARFMHNLFPFSYLPASILPEPTASVTGEGGGASAAPGEMLTALVQSMTLHTEIRYMDGIIISTYQQEHILSPVSGIITDKGTDRSNEIGDYLVVQLSDGMLITIGFLQDIRVGRLDHIQVGTALGVGTVIEELGEEAYFYLSVQNREGEFQDPLEFFKQMVDYEE